jgi:hypothetical protein
MRIWSIHPKYLDTKGLLAQWREGLLALHVLRGQTKGYKNHPQLIRFKLHPQPVAALSAYLHTIVDEAETRAYAFKREKLEPLTIVSPITVTTGQFQYETLHLQRKLKVRDTKKFTKYKSAKQFDIHPLFTIVTGEIETWERPIE